MSSYSVSSKKNSTKFSTLLAPFYVFLTPIGLKPYTVFERRCCRFVLAEHYSNFGLLTAVFGLLFTGGTFLFETFVLVATILATHRLLGDGTTWAFQSAVLCFTAFFNSIDQIIYSRRYYSLIKLLNEHPIANGRQRIRFVVVFYVVLAVSILLQSILQFMINTDVKSSSTATWEWDDIGVNGSKLAPFIQQNYLILQTIFGGVMLLFTMNFMGMAIHLALSFDDHAERFQADWQQGDRQLATHFDQFCELVNVLTKLDQLFSHVNCVNIFTIITLLCLLVYLTMASFLRTTESASTQFVDSWTPLLMAIQGTLFLVIWFLISVIPAIYLNEKSRQLKGTLLITLVGPDPELESQKDQFLQILNDRDWGITMGKFFLIDRASFLTLCGMVFTFMMLWIQLNM